MSPVRAITVIIYLIFLLFAFISSRSSMFFSSTSSFRL
ncbi:hypothetical protein C426_1402 [Lactococcus garvieae DCC43]|uniref:Uncharacterized protein n=1 Tax=Lactococcus garvieae DCC43 TaxID=1231377 RepID=K2NUQ5_9LACT|nr:hypothetical protein C426_1402 [Lactococcus garvieae DCC43]